MGHKKNKHHQPKHASKKTSQYEEKRPSDPPEVIIQEGLAFQELMSKSRDNLNAEDNKYGYLLSTKWYSSWKEYTGYEELIKGQDPQKSKYFAKKKPGKLNTDIIGKNDKYYKIPEQLPEYEYLNVVLDEQAAKDRDFIVVDSKVFTFLYEKYEGHIIKRPLRKRKSGPYFDCQLHYFSVVFLSPEDIEKIMDASDGQIKKHYDSYIEVKRMQVSSLWGITAFKEFLSSYLAVALKVEKQPADIGVWKWESFLSFKETKLQLIESLRTASYKISARKLDLEEENDWDLDDCLKDSYLIFVESNGIKFQRAQLPKQISGYCEECIKDHKLIEKCPCGKTFYCSVQCRYDDKAFHFRTCPAAYESSDDQEYLEKKIDTHKRPSKCGLRNLGNTCYMNSSLQCLANIPQIADYFCSNRYLDHLNKKEVEDNGAVFIKKFAKFIKKLYQNDEYAPWSIKMQISYYISIFKGYEQHDANDFLVYLVNNLNDFSSKEQHSNFAEFIQVTFLGQFDSVVNCPECTTTSNTKDPFLEVSVPLKPKIPVKELHYCIIKDWRNSIKGVCQARETWQEVGNDIGFKDNEVKKMVGSGERSDLKEIIEDSPEEVSKKHRKDTVYFYPMHIHPTKQTTVELQINMAYIKVLAGNQVKCYYGNPVFVNVGQNKMSFAIYQQIASIFEVGAQNLQLLESYIIKCQGQYDALLKAQKERDQGREKQRKQKQLEKKGQEEQKVAEVKEEKKTRDQERKRKQQLNRLKEDQRREKEKELTQFEGKINQQFQATYASVVGFRVFIKSTRKGKRVCVFCLKKCSGCLLPFSVTKTVQQYIKLSQDEFKLEIVFDQIQQLKQQSRPSNFNQYTTIDQCLIEFSKPQQLDQQNAWYCGVCNDMRLAFKQLKIDKYPRTLAIQLKRFKEQHGKKVKNNEVIWYPETFLVEGGLKYHLNSVIVHEGSLEGGHYWAICRKGEKFYSFNDEKVREERDHFSKNAYILFYQR